MHNESHHEGLTAISPQEGPQVVALPGVGAIFYLPITRLSVSKYAELTGQNVRTVSQQINRGKLPLSESAARERQINMLSLFLRDYVDAMNTLQIQEQK